jgi:hypothetical protein
VSQDPPHDPTEQDEQEAIRLQRIVDTTGLRADGGGDGVSRTADGQEVRCSSCRYYLNPRDALAYCWHPQLQLLVGAGWRCQHHDPAPEGTA